MSLDKGYIVLILCIIEGALLIFIARNYLGILGILFRRKNKSNRNEGNHVPVVITSPLNFNQNDHQGVKEQKEREKFLQSSKIKNAIQPSEIVSAT